MNHHTIEFLANDRIAGMRHDAEQHGYAPVERAARRPSHGFAVGFRRLIARVASATLVAARHG